MLKARTVATIAIPGKSATHQLSAKSCAPASPTPSKKIEPQLAVGGFAPMPRYARPASSAMTISDGKRRAHKHRCRDVGQEVSPKNARDGDAECARGLDVLLTLCRECFGADEPRHAKPSGESERRDETRNRQVRPKHQQEEQQQDARYRHESIEQPHHRHIGASTGVAGDQSVGGTDGRRQ